MKNKSIWIFCQYAQEPPYNTMFRYHSWGKLLAQKGYDVTIFAGSFVHNTDIDVIEKRGTDETEVDGIHYVYLKINKYQGNGLKRILAIMKFRKLVVKRTKKMVKPDYIVETDAYDFSYYRRHFKNTKVIVDISDLIPLGIVEYKGTSNNHPLVKYLYGQEKKAYISCDALIFSMEGGIDYVKERKYASKVDLNKIFHINMGIDLAQNDKNLQEAPFEPPFDKNKFNIGYLGSIRVANNIKQICDAALAVQQDGYKDIEFHIYGNGDELENLQQYVKDNNINNIHFYGRIEKKYIPAILTKTSANILTYKQVGLMKYGGSQSKLFDALAAGRPILCNAKFGYNLITRYNCGVVTDEQTPEAFKKAVLELYNMPKSELDQMGKNGRKAAIDYDIPVLVDKFIGVLDYLDKKGE